MFAAFVSSGVLFGTHALKIVKCIWTVADAIIFAFVSVSRPRRGLVSAVQSSSRFLLVMVHYPAAEIVDVTMHYSTKTGTSFFLKIELGSDFRMLMKMILPRELLSLDSPIQDVSSPETTHEEAVHSVNPFLKHPTPCGGFIGGSRGWARPFFKFARGVIHSH